MTKNHAKNASLVKLHRFPLSHPIWTLLLLILIGLGLRLLLFSGDGLGDDHGYFLAVHEIFQGNFRLSDNMYQHRFSYWIPQWAVWKLFGISEFTFILPILLSSLGCMAMVYLIGKELFDTGTALIAVALMAVHPFEVLNATLISTDVNLSLYQLLSVYWFLRAQKEFRHRYFILSALFVFFSFVNKPVGIYILPVLGLCFLFRHGFSFWFAVRYWAFVLTLGLSFCVLFAGSWWLTNDALIFFNVYQKETWSLLWDRFQLLAYPKQMFGPYVFGEWLHGLHFYAVAACLLFIRRDNWKPTLLCFGWLVVIFSCINFMPHRIEDGVWYAYSQRIFRYLVVLIPPSVLFLAYFWNRLRLFCLNQARPPDLGLSSIFFAYRYTGFPFKRFRVVWMAIFPLLFGGYLALSVSWAVDVTQITRIAFGELREIVREVKDLGKVRLFADRYFIYKLQRLGFQGEFLPRWHVWDNIETAEEWHQAFLRVNQGYVITGGPRLPYYGCYDCIPNLSGFQPPKTWKLIREFDGTLHPPWKTEPLRVWHVSASNKVPLRAIRIVDTAFERCLRGFVFPLRPEDGLAHDHPITNRLAYQVDRIECIGMHIQQVPELKFFANTQVLNLSENQLTSIDVTQLQELQMLLVGGNKLTQIRGVPHLKYLHTLWLGGNQLKSLDFSGLRSMADLRVDDNQLKTIQGHQSLHKLKVGHFERNPALHCRRKDFPNPNAKVYGCQK